MTSANVSVGADAWTPRVSGCEGKKGEARSAAAAGLLLGQDGSRARRTEMGCGLLKFFSEKPFSFSKTEQTQLLKYNSK